MKYPAGQYYVDVLLNGVQTGRMPLTVTPVDEQAAQLCLSQEWLENVGIFFSRMPIPKRLTVFGGVMSLVVRTLPG